MNHTVAEVGNEPVHLESIDLNKEVVQLHIIVIVNGKPEQWTVDYNGIPDMRLVQRYAEAGSCHMMRFHEKDGQMHLGDGGSDPRFICPCDWWRTRMNPSYPWFTGH